MGEEAIVKKLNAAIDILMDKYDPEFFTRIKIKDPTCPYHLEIFRRSKKKGDEVLKFRVALDKISDLDIKLCQNYYMPDGIFTKFIACKTGRGRKNWIYKPIL